MSPKFEHFKNISAGIQSIILSIAVIIGGVWGFYKFNAQLNIENARARLEKLKREIHQQSVLEISIEANQLVTQASDDLLILGKVIVCNRGDRNTTLKFDTENGPVLASLIELPHEGGIKFHQTYRAEIYGRPGEPAAGKISLAKNTDQMQFLVRVDKPGLYLLTFISSRLGADAETAAAADSDAEEFLWHAAAFLEVK